MKWRIGAAAVLLLGAAGATAQERDEAKALSPLFACRAITLAEERLACFDRATTALAGQVRDKQVRVVDRQDIRTAKRSLFGFTLPRIDLFTGGRDGPDATEEFTELNTTIVSSSLVNNGRVQFRVAEGDAVWVTTDPLNFPPRPGSKVRIRKGALGNYFISIAGERSIRGMRLR